MKSFKLYRDNDMPKEERLAEAKKNGKRALFLLLICPWIVIAVGIIIYFWK